MIVICKNKKKNSRKRVSSIIWCLSQAEKGLCILSNEMIRVSICLSLQFSLYIEVMLSCEDSVSSLHSLSLTLPSPLPSFLLFFLSHKPLLHTNVLQLSPEEGYVSAKEDAFLCPPHSCKEPGLPDKALFRADLALVSGNN